MPRDLLLPTLAGVAAGLVVALLAVAVWIRRQRRAADGILATARSEGARLRAEAARDAEAAKSEMLVGARMETLKLREELDREVLRRREEFLHTIVWLPSGCLRRTPSFPQIMGNIQKLLAKHGK